MNMDREPAKPLFGWWILGGCYGALWYQLIDLPLRIPRTNLPLLHPWDPMMVPVSFLIGAVFMGTLFEELASRRWIPSQRVFWGILGVLVLIWFEMLGNSISPDK